VVAFVPTELSMAHLAGAALAEQDDALQVSRRWFMVWS
jgi:hypothetical protein